MQTFVIGLPHDWLLRRLGRNRLVRTSDRIQAIAIIALLVVVVAIIPVVTTVAMAFHHRQAAMYEQRSETVHPATARVTEDSSAMVAPGVPEVYPTPISWYVTGLQRTGFIDWSRPLKTGDRIGVWIDATGTLDRQPVSADHAVTDAALVGLLLWSVSMGVALGSLRALVWRLDRGRSACWDRDLRALVDDGGRADPLRRHRDDVD